MSLQLTGYSAIRNNELWLNGNRIFIATEHIVQEAFQYLKLNYPRFHKMDNLCKTGFIAVEVLSEANALKSCQPEEIALVIATREGCLETDVKFEKSTHDIPSPGLFVYTLPNILLGELSIRHNIKGENACFVLGIFDPDFISAYVQGIFNQGNTKACIIGWVNHWNNQPEAFFCLIEASSELNNDIRVSQAIKSNYNSIWKN
jgi:hypothetical protein